MYSKLTLSICIQILSVNILLPFEDFWGLADHPRHFQTTPPGFCYKVKLANVVTVLIGDESSTFSNYASLLTTRFSSGGVSHHEFGVISF